LDGIGALIVERAVGA